MARALTISRPHHSSDAWRARLPAAKRRFRKIFPGGFHDETYLEWERDYKWAAHLAWQGALGRPTWAALLAAGEHREIARRIISVYARSHLNMLAIYEWMALRDALTNPIGARVITQGLYDLIHGRGQFERRIETFARLLDTVPQRQTKLAKWPVATLFPFVARPESYLIVKPRLMKRAAERLGFELAYVPRPSGPTYAAIISYVTWLRHALAAWHPKDLIDIQGFIWVTCSEEYEEWPWE